MRWRHLPIVAFDTETTGLEPFGGDRVIEFAAVVPEGKITAQHVLGRNFSHDAPKPQAFRLAGQ